MPNCVMCVPKLDLDVEGMPEVAADEDGWRLLLAADPVHPAGGKDQGLARGEVHLETLSWHLGILSCESIVKLHVCIWFIVWFIEEFMSSIDVHSQTTGSEKGLFSILGS